MARIKIALPYEVNLLYQAQYQILITDINYGNHLSHDRVLSICHEMRLRFLKHHGKSEMKFFGQDGLIMNEALINYKAEAFHGEKLNIQLFLGEITPSSFEIFYKLSKENTNQEVARVKTGFNLFNYEFRKITKISDSIMQQIEQLKSH